MKKNTFVLSVLAIFLFGHTSFSQIALTITGLTGDDKSFDGTTAATASGTPSLSGVVPGDDVSLGGAAVFTFASSDIAAGIAVSTSGYTLSGTDAGDYTLTQPALSADIIALTVYDFITAFQTSNSIFMTKEFEAAIDYLNTLTGAATPAQKTDFRVGTESNGQLFIEDDLQGIIDAINAGGIMGCTLSAASNYNDIATIDDGTCCPTIDPSSAATSDDPCTAGVNEAAINLTIIDDDPSSPYSINWTSDDPNFSSTNEDLSDLNAGFYSVTITDANSCTATASYFLLQFICFGPG